MAEPTEPWQEPVMGHCIDPAVLGLPGIDQVQAIIDGLAPKPPIHYLTGMRPTEIGPGSASFCMPASRWLLCSQGVIDPGALSILADGPLGSALQSTLPPMVPYTTAEISVNYVRPTGPMGAGADLVATASIISQGPMGLTDARITDGDGNLVAHATSRCLVLPSLGPRASSIPRAPDPGPGLAPFERSAQGEVLPPEIWQNLPGKAILERQIAGDLPLAPISVLTGKRPAAVGEGTCRYEMPASPWLHSPFPRIEGGAIAMLGDSAMAGAVQSTIPAGASFAPLDLKVNFLRPVLGDGRPLRADGTVIHRGRSLAVTTCTMTDADGRAVALASGTASIQGRP